MKKSIVLAVSIFIAACVVAQNAVQVKPAAMYVCTKAGCPMCSHEQGKCSHHQTTLVLEGKYYCPMHPEITADTTGTCSKCHMALVKMETKKRKKVMMKEK
jgi:hypothetical protein